MSSRSFPLLRTILKHDLNPSNHLTLQPILRNPHPHFTSSNFHHHQQPHHHRPSQGRQSRLMHVSGLGIVLIGAAGSYDSDQQQNFDETNFDTIRPLHTRQPSSRSTLPSFTSSPALSMALDRNSSGSSDSSSPTPENFNHTHTSHVSARTPSHELTTVTQFTPRPIPSTSNPGSHSTTSHHHQHQQHQHQYHHQHHHQSIDSHEYHSLPPELVPFPLQNTLTSPPTKFTHLVKSKIQRTARRSISHSWSSSLLLPLHKHPSSTPSVYSSSIPYPHTEPTNSDPITAGCYRSLPFSHTSENLQAITNQSSPPLGIPDPDHEVESLLDRRGVPPHPPPSLRPSFSQPFMADQYRKTSLGGNRRPSVAGQRLEQMIPRPAASALGIGGPTLGAFSSRAELAAKPNGGNSPPRKSVRTHLSRLAQLLTPSPTLKYPPITSTKAKIPSPPMESRSQSSTGVWSETSSELPSRQFSSTALGAPQVISSCQKPNAVPIAIINWRTTLSDREYRQILETWGPTEIHRQQLIWELCQTETAFLDSIAVILDLFITPLREDSQYGTWVVGVPEPVQNLFADLDQIANFHSEIVMGMSYNRMCEKKRNKAAVVLKFADMMAGFVPRLRIYERYLVCFERVSQLIDRLSLDPADPFGSFVRMQSHNAGFGAMTLTSYLLKPIQRLMKYPLFFRQLCETTPLGHPDHQSTSNLWKATDGIIRSMQDVKGIEDDHEALRALEEQLLGLPERLVLANRRRKIVIRGILQMVYPSPKDILKLSFITPNPERETVGEMTSTCRRMSSTSHLSSLALRSDFNSRVPSKGIIRSLSPVSDSSEASETSHSRSSFHSINTETTCDATSSPQPLVSEISHQPRSTSGCSSQSAPRSEMPGDLDPIKLKPPRSLQSKRSSHKLRKGRGIPTEAVEVILLTDMLILCTREAPPKKNWRSSSRKPEDLDRFRVIDGIGLSRLTCVEDLAGQLADFDDLVKLDLKPLGGIPQRRASPAVAQEETSRSQEHSIYLSSGPASHSSPMIWGHLGSAATNNLGIEKDWKNWLKEFRKLQVLTHHTFHRQLNHSEPKRRRSTTSRMDLAIKKCSSMSNLVT